MKAFNLFKVSLVAFSFTFAITGCVPEDRSDKDTQTASDNEQAEFISTDVVNMADAAYNGKTSFKNEEGAGALGGGCATVSRDTSISSDPDTITIDFGTSNCLCADGRYRRGIVRVFHTGNWITAGSFRTITFSNYFVNDYQVEGTHTVTANGKNSAGHYNWTIKADNMKITRPDGKSHLWSSTRTREWVEGDGTLFNWLDDVYHITGNASGTNVNGLSYAADITKPVRHEIKCRWFTSGTVVLKPSGKMDRTLDLGNGNCDNEATVTIGKKTYTIHMH